MSRSRGPSTDPFLDLSGSLAPAVDDTVPLVRRGPALAQHAPPDPTARLALGLAPTRRAPPGDALPPDTVLDEKGDLIVKEFIGRGGFGAVYKVTQRSLNRTVAAKVVARQHAEFLAEARLAARLKHDGLVEIHGFDVVRAGCPGAAGQPFLLMEFVEGPTMEEAISTGRPWLEWVPIFQELLRPVDHIHQRGIVHSDLKPPNVILDRRTGRPKVLDLGLAGQFRELPAELQGVSVRTRPQRALMGTAGYLPPEDSDAGGGIELHPRRDVFAVGVMFYQALSNGKHPYRERAGLVCAGAPTPLRSWAPQIPQALAEVVDRAVCADPAQRYQDAGALLEALAALPPLRELGPAPYLGLLAFQREDRENFFGREKLTEKLRAQMWDLFQGRASAPRILLLLGPSGCGKSSVARAGLLPALEDEGVRAVVLTPGERPIEALARALLTLYGQRQGPQDFALLQETRERLARPDLRGDLDGLRLFAQALPGAPLLCVLVDQFEEIYTQCADGPERDVFVELLRCAAGEGAGQVAVVLTLRSDFWGEVYGRHPGLSRAATVEVVRAMETKDQRRAITEPAARAEAPLDDATADLILEQASGGEGALPQMEYTLLLLWEAMRQGRRPEDELRRLEGVGGAVARRAQEVYDGLAVEEPLARRVFLGLVQLGEGARATRRRVEVNRLGARGEKGEKVMEVLQRFAEARLVTLSWDEEAKEAVAELAHEALLERWGTLKEWLEKGRDDLRFQRRLEEAAREWQRQGRDADLLFRGAALEQLRAFVARRGEDLGPLEQEFWVRSDEHQRQRAQARARTRRVVRLAIGLAAAGVMAVLVVWGAKDRQMARLARHLLLEKYVETGRHFHERGDFQRAMAWLSRAYSEGADGEGLRQLLHDTTARVGRRLFTLRHEGEVSTAEFSPDGKRLLTASFDKTAKIWDARDGRLLHTLAGHSGKLWTAHFSPDGRLIVTTGEDHDAVLWDAGNGTLLRRLKGHRGWIHRSEFSPDGRRLLTASYDKMARLWEVQTGRPLLVFTHAEMLWAAKFSPDGRFVATASDDRTTKIWDAESGRLLRTLGPQGGPVRVVAWSPDGSLVATGSDDGAVKLWTTSTGGLKLTLREGGADSISYRQIWTLQFSPDGEFLMAASIDRSIAIWRVQSGLVERSMEAQTNLLLHAAFSPDGSIIAAGGGSGGGAENPARTTGGNRVQIWSREGKLLSTLDGHALSIRMVAFSPNGHRIILASADHTATVWDLSWAAQHRELRHSVDITSGTFAPKGDRVLTTTKRGGVIWDASTGSVIRNLLHESAHGEFSPDGSRVITAGMDGVAKVWDVETGKVLLTFPGQGLTLRYVGFSPDGQLLFTARHGAEDEGGEIDIWSAHGGEHVLSLPCDKTCRSSRSPVEFSPDGSAVMLLANRLQIWDMRRRQLRGHLDLPEEVGIQDFRFSLDGKRILVASWEGIAWLMETQTGKIIHALEGHTSWIHSARFSPDGAFIATAGGDGLVWIWDGRTGRQLRSLRHSAGVLVARFSPRGGRIVTVSNGEVALWETSSGKRLKSENLDGVTDAMFNAEGTRILGTGPTKVAKVWDVPLESRSPVQIAEWTRCRGALQFDGDRLALQDKPPQGCPQIVSEEPPPSQTSGFWHLWHASHTRRWAGGGLAKRHFSQALAAFRAVKDRQNELLTRWVQREHQQVLDSLRRDPIAETPVVGVLRSVGEQCHEWLHDSDAALAAYEHARALDPKHPGILSDRLEALLAAGRLADVLRDAGAAWSAQETEPASVRAWRRAILSSLAWAAASLVNNRQSQARWAAQARAAYAQAPSEKYGWQFGGLRHAMNQRPASPARDRVLKVIDLLDGEKDAARAKKLTALLR